MFILSYFAIESLGIYMLEAIMNVISLALSNGKTHDIDYIEEYVLVRYFSSSFRKRDDGL